MLPEASADVARILADFEKRVSRLERLEDGGGWILIEDIELAIAAATMDFQSIPTTFKHLIIMGSARSTVAATVDSITLRLNNDGGANYDALRANIRHNAVLATAENLAATFMFAAQIPGNTAPANNFAGFFVYIADYLDTNKFKDAVYSSSIMTGTTTGLIFVASGSGIWKNTAAVNRVTLGSETGPNFLADTRASLYGLR